jgi:anthranilate phosphoribosyltransferase
LEILKGGQGARRDITVLNAAATFMIAGRVKDFNEGIELANRSIDSGDAFNTLQRAVKFTNAELRYLRNKLV